MGVALDSPDQPDIGVRIDENLDVAELAHPLVDEQQNAIDDDDVRWLDCVWSSRRRCVTKSYSGLSIGSRVC